MSTLVVELEEILSRSVSEVLEGLHFEQMSADESGDLGMGQGAITVVQDFEGDRCGSLAVGARPHTAVHVYETLTGQAVSSDDDDTLRDALGELLNMVTGHCQKHLRSQDLRISVSPPLDLHSPRPMRAHQDIEYILVGVDLWAPDHRIVFRLIAEV